MWFEVFQGFRIGRFGVYSVRSRDVSAMGIEAFSSFMTAGRTGKPVASLGPGRRAESSGTKHLKTYVGSCEDILSRNPLLPNRQHPT